jgi:nucleoside 2-deoxyribosyltransferase
MPPKIYLAGPEVFLPDAIDVGQRKKALCEQYGFLGLFPLDNEMADLSPNERLDQAIYKVNLALIGEADIGICNLTPFWGINADVGTVFELGMLLGLRKPVFGYTNHPDDLLARTVATRTVVRRGTGNFDENGMLVEDFGNCDNLMIDASLALTGRPIVKPTDPILDPLRDLRGFERCLAFAKTEVA